MKTEFRIGLRGENLTNQPGRNIYTPWTGHVDILLSLQVSSSHVGWYHEIALQQKILHEINVT